MIHIAEWPILIAICNKENKCFISLSMYLSRYLNLIKNRRNKKNLDDCPQYEKDFDLTASEKHYMFWEYLEIGKI